MKARVKWIEDVQFIGESGTGHSLIMDGPEERGGHGTGMRPMELLLLGLGGCTSFDVVEMLKKSRQKIDNCVVEVSAERSEKVPKVFTHIHVHFIITGDNIKESQVKRAIELSAEKYCSASLMLGKAAKITHDYVIINTDIESSDTA
jgi:putative redox protein